jgi:hypothetical protein
MSTKATVHFLGRSVVSATAMFAVLIIARIGLGDPAPDAVTPEAAAPSDVKGAGDSAETVAQSPATQAAAKEAPDATGTEAAKPAAADKPKATIATPAAGLAKKSEGPKENLGQRKQGDVGRNEELGFQQSKVTAQMLELEERMFRLSEALKSLEPENASRLLMGLKYAREELIQLQMKEIQAALTSLNFRDAALEQKHLLAKLQRLEQLLLSPDLDFQLQLERLRLMRDLLRRLDGAIQEEEREKTASDRSAEIEKQLAELRARIASLQELVHRQGQHVKEAEVLAGVKTIDKTEENPAPVEKPAGDDNPRGAALAALKTDQEKTRALTEPLETGVELIADAGKKMDLAVSRLTINSPDEALPNQTEALELLKQAMKMLRADEQKLEKELADDKFAAMRKDQADNRKTSEGISETAVQLGDAGTVARGELIRATGSMSSAEGNLSNRDPSTAGTAQGEALASLKYAREQLSAEADKLLGRLRAEIKKRTIEGLAQMLEGQIVVRQSTERLGPRVKDGARAVLTSVTGLAAAETKLIVIGEGLTALVEETEFGIALPAALRSVTEAMGEARERLAATDASEEVIAAEQRIEEDLQALLEAMKQLPSTGDSDKKQAAGNAAARERQLNRLIAELKMVRMLQVRVNRDTKDVDQRRPAEIKELSTNLIRRIELLQGRQEDVHDVTERIAAERGDEIGQ